MKRRNTAIPRDVINRRRPSSGGKMGYERGAFRSIFAGKGADGLSKRESG